MPEVTVKLKDPNDEFLVLACDGVWDVMSNEDLYSYVRHQLAIEKSLGNVCSNIIDTSLHKGSKDNLSVVVVTFPGAPAVSAEAQARDQDLNRSIAVKARDILNKNKDYILPDLMDELYAMEWTDLPPGGGLESKRNLIEDIFNSFNDKNNANFETNNINNSED